MTILNGRTNAAVKRVNQFEEVGTGGLETWSGYIKMAYDTKLEWPSVFPLYNRIRRSDSEIGGIVRPMYMTWGRRVSLNVELPQGPSDDDKAYQEYLFQMLEEIEGGESKFLDTLISHVPFMGWGLWEAPLGLRNGRAYDGWVSEYNDGLPAVRKLAFRDHSSFERWELDDRTGELRGMWQYDMPNDPVMIPIENSVHITYGDPNNPEGLSPLESVWRLERIKYGLETIFGIGAEHTAGHLSVESEKPLGADDKTAIRQAARAIMSAQEGNYAAWPPGVKGLIIDTPFSAAGSLLEAIRYYGLLKLQVYAMHSVAIATTAGTGAFSAAQDASNIAIMSFNGMMEGFAKQIDEQVGKRLYRHPLVKQRFPGLTQRPKITVNQIDKTIPLQELAQFAQILSPLMPWDDEDWKAIRQKSEFLNDVVPEVEEIEEPEPVESEDDNFDLSLYWSIRHDLYSDKKIPFDLQASLLEQLENATNNREMATVRKELRNGEASI